MGNPTKNTARALIAFCTAVVVVGCGPGPEPEQKEPEIITVYRLPPAVTERFGAAAGVVAAADSARGACLTVRSPVQSDDGPHTSAGDEFCWREAGGQMFLIPGAGMENWSSTDGDEAIKLEPDDGNISGMYWFEALIKPHDPEDKEKHENYSILILSFGSLEYAEIENHDTHEADPPVSHGATAHATN